MTPVFPGASSRRSAPLFTCCSWRRRPVPASARARIEGTRREKPPRSPADADALMHNARLHLLGFLRCLLFGFVFSPFLPMPHSLSSVLCRLPGSCGVAGGELEGGLPHGFLLQPELRAVGSQPPRQPTCAGASQTGEPD